MNNQINTIEIIAKWNKKYLKAFGWDMVTYCIFSFILIRYVECAGNGEVEEWDTFHLPISLIESKFGINSDTQSAALLLLVEKGILKTFFKENKRYIKMNTNYLEEKNNEFLETMEGIRF
jgi:hypothetical protein